MPAPGIDWIYRSGMQPRPNTYYTNITLILTSTQAFMFAGDAEITGVFT